MITRYSQLGQPKDAIELFIDMVASGFIPDRFTFSSTISAFSELELLSLGQQLHSLVVKSRLTLDVCVGCSLVDIYVKCAVDGSMVNSRKVFDQMPDHNVLSWTATITGYVQSGGHDKEAIELYCRMIEGQVVPSHLTFSSLLKACGNLSDPAAGEQIYTNAVKHGLPSVNCVGNSLISMYARPGRMEDARKAFDILFEKNLVSYSTIDTGIEVDAFTYASLLSGAASIGAVGKGEQIHAQLIKAGFKSNQCISNALISMYSKCGNIEAALQAFTDIEDHTVISWTSIVMGLAKHGFATGALKMFQEMLKTGIKPNEVTYVAVLSGCSHVGMINEGWKHFNAMYEEHGISPRMEHYACMVDLLGRSGFLEEAIQFINSMPFMADALVWRTLLGAWQVHGNTEVVKHAAKMIIKQEPNDPAAYILLSNLYPSSGQWDEVVRIRKNMKERNLVKEAGCTENRVYKFHVGDTSHPQAREIYEELDQLSQDKGVGLSDTLDSLLRGGGNLYSVRDKPMLEAMAELWRGVPMLPDKMMMLFYGENGMAENQKRRKELEVFAANMKEKMASGHQETLNQLKMGFETVSKLLLIQGSIDSLLRSGGNLYSVQNKPMPEAMAELWRGMTRLDTKKQTTEVKDVLDLEKRNVAEIKTQNEIVTAISSKMNILVSVSPHVAPSSPSPPPPPPSPICNGGGGSGGGSNGD
ncbi:unnamed protein product [Camellia sinensis]